QIDAGVVQEPALTLLAKSGARVLMNGMDLADARKYLGGSYEFMGVAVRGSEFAARKAEMAEVAKALTEALKALRTMNGDQLTAARPRPDDFLWRRAGPLRRQPDRGGWAFRQPGRAVRFRQVEPAAGGDRVAAAARRHGRNRARAIRHRHPVPGRCIIAVEDG